MTNIIPRGRGIVILIILLFFSMFRGDHVGNDTLNYLSDTLIQSNVAQIRTTPLERMREQGLGNSFEISFMALNWIVYTLNLPPRLIIYVFSILHLGLLYAAFKKMDIDIAVGLMFYVLSSLYFFSLTAARQMVAVSFFIYGLTFLFENSKRSLLFFPYLLLATSFHVSSFFFFWVYFLRYVRLNRNIIFIIAIAVVLLTTLLSFNITNIIYRLFNVEYVARYMGLFDDSARSLMGRIYDLLKFSFILFVFFFRKEENEEADLYDVLFIVGVILMALFGHADMLISRVTYYITIFIPLYITKVFVEKEGYRDIVFMSLLSLYCFLCIYEFGGWAVTLTSGYYLMF